VDGSSGPPESVWGSMLILQGSGVHFGEEDERLWSAAFTSTCAVSYVHGAAEVLPPVR
jgi:hypothetical protein